MRIGTELGVDSSLYFANTQFKEFWRFNGGLNFLTAYEYASGGIVNKNLALWKGIFKLSPQSRMYYSVKGSRRSVVGFRSR